MLLNSYTYIGEGKAVMEGEGRWEGKRVGAGERGGDWSPPLCGGKVTLLTLTVRHLAKTHPDLMSQR